MLQSPGWSKNATWPGQPAIAPPAAATWPPADLLSSTSSLRAGAPTATGSAAAGPGPEADSSSSSASGAQVAAAGSLLALLVVWTLLGNVLVCAAILSSRHLRAKVTNIFIVSLAVSDLLVALLVMPWKAVAEVAGYWPFGAFFCDVWVAFDIMCSTASILNLCVISVDRYWAISSPFRYERKMSPRLALLMVGGAWALALLISFIPVQLNWHKGPTSPAGTAGTGRPDDESNSNATLSLEGASESCDASLNRTYAVSSSLISFYIPVAIMLVTYTRIYRIAQGQIRRISSLERAAEHARNCRQSRRSSSSCLACPHPSAASALRKETKVLKTLATIMGVFVCCWLPFFVLNCLVPFCGQPSACVSDATFNVFVWFGWANSSLNPIIYAFNADFRKVFSRLLGCGAVGGQKQCSPGETANLSHELVSCTPQEGLFQRPIAATACANMLPNVIGGHAQEGPAAFDHRMAQISPDQEEEEEAAATDAAGDLDVSLDKIIAPLGSPQTVYFEELRLTPQATLLLLNQASECFR